MMPKSTIFFASLCLLLTALLVAAVGWLMQDDQEHTLAAGAARLGISLPQVQGQHDQQEEYTGSAVLWDTETSSILFAEGGFERRPIASITKLMTAMVALDMGVDWNKQMTIEPNEYTVGGRLLLHNGESVTVRDLFFAALTGSANNAMLALVRSLDIDEREFVQEMNRKAIALGLEQTQFVDVTGLSPDNVSTAYEVARLAEAAFRDYPEIAEATTIPAYSFVVGQSGREHTISNTNKLITEEGLTLSGGKTGYLYEAEYCLTAQGSGEERSRIAVVLGKPSEEASVHEVKSLLQLAYGEL